MKEVHWGEAFNAASQYQQRNKVLLVMFADPECDVCNHLIPFIDHYADNHPDDYEAVVVKNWDGFPFPPVSTPVAHIFIPNCPDPMPISRLGTAPPDVLKQDIELQIKCMKEGVSYAESKK